MKLKISKIVNNFFSRRTWFIILMSLSTLALAGSAAYYSVFGLSSLFAGAKFEVIIMASALEFSKLIVASYLHNNWKSAGWMKWYLIIALTTLMIITSAGIYGFLTSAYQKTADQLGVLDKQVEVIELKKNRFEESLDGYKLERNQLNGSITELTKGLSNNTIQYKDRETGEIITTTSSSTRKVLTEQLNDMKAQRNNVSIKMEVLTDSITKLDLRVLDLEINNEVAAEVGPLRYMAEITGKSMGVIVNWFTLLIVFVFDPLAISMVIALNKLMNKKKDDEEDYYTIRNRMVNEHTIKNKHKNKVVIINDNTSDKLEVDDSNDNIETQTQEPIDTDNSVNIYGDPIKKRYNDSVVSNQNSK